jgi:hypothetical protein
MADDTFPKCDSFEDALDGLRKWVNHLGDYVEGCDAQKADIAFWLPRFEQEFIGWGVEMITIPDPVYVYGLDNCVNYQTNVLGDCAGRVEKVKGRIICETCRNR